MSIVWDLLITGTCRESRCLLYPYLLKLAACLVVIGLLCAFQPPLFGQVTTVSAASYGPAVAPGSIASAFGVGFSLSTQSAALDSTGQLPVTLAGVSVTLAGQKCPLFYVSPTQVNFLVPLGTSAGQVVLSIGTASGSVLTGLANIVQHAPAIFLISGNRGAIENAVSGALEPFEAASGNTRLSVFATGLNAAVKDSTQFAASVQRFDGSIEPLTVEYAGPQGQFNGLDQVNVLLPSDLDGAGEVQLFVQAGGAESNHVPLVIRQANPPSSISISPTSASPNQTVSLQGPAIATVNAGQTTGTPRYLVTFEDSGRVVMTASPTLISVSEIRVSAPYDPLPDGSSQCQATTKSA